MSKKRKIAIITGMFLICAVVIGIYGFKQYLVKSSYDQAIKYIKQENYESAIEKLEDVKKHTTNDDYFSFRIIDENDFDKYYKDFVVLYAYAEAMNEYKTTKSLYAVNELLNVIPDDYSGELSEDIKAFKDSFTPEYNQYTEEQKRLEEERERELRASYATKVPYEGMSEKYINDTLVGKADRHDSEKVNGGMRSEFVVEDYVWYSDDGRDITLIVKCKEGIVTDVIKYGIGYYWTADGKPDFSAVNPYRTNSKSSRKTSSKTQKDDPYDVYSYSDEEDFYYDNYDDFDSYEDAEDYYNEHYG